MELFKDFDLWNDTDYALNEYVEAELFGGYKFAEDFKQKLFEKIKKYE